MCTPARLPIYLPSPPYTKSNSAFIVYPHIHVCMHQAGSCVLLPPKDAGLTLKALKKWPEGSTCLLADTHTLQV
jgi:hypothetical protein